MQHLDTQARNNILKYATSSYDRAGARARRGGRARDIDHHTRSYS
eukprot:SAG31_NODE_24427_length_481_cov_1.075916_1_plen_44_part_01